MAGAEAALPFRPVRGLAAAGDGIGALVDTMDAVDHSVRPVGGANGGSTRGGSGAGYARWAAFLARGGLRDYAARRNDGLDPSGASPLF